MSFPGTINTLGKLCFVRRCLLLGALAIVFLVVFEAGRVLFGSNFHEVLPDKVYRCAQPSAEALAHIIAGQGIRTVVNLRGCCADFAWYADECRVTHDSGIAQEDICLSAGRLPAVQEIRRFAEVLEHAEYPLLLHCRRGADRTGMAAAIALLWNSDVDLERASQQLGLRFGHVALGRPSHLDLFFELYVDWLKAQERAHDRITFRHWLRHEYCAGPYRADLAWIEPMPTEVPRGEPVAFHVRAHNAGIRTWRFRPGSSAGVHVGLHVWDELDRHLLWERSGLRDAEVKPGQSIALSIAIPPFERPGRYRLMVDLIDEPHGSFYQMGSEPLEAEIIVRE